MKLLFVVNPISGGKNKETSTQSGFKRGSPAYRRQAKWGSFFGIVPINALPELNQ